MSRPKTDPVEAALDCFFDLRPSEQAQFDRERRTTERRLQRYLSTQAPPQAIFVQGEPLKKRRGRPPKVRPQEQPPEA